MRATMTFESLNPREHQELARLQNLSYHINRMYYFSFTGTWVSVYHAFALDYLHRIWHDALKIRWLGVSFVKHIHSKPNQGKICQVQTCFCFDPMRSVWRKWTSSSETLSGKPWATTEGTCRFWKTLNLAFRSCLTYLRKPHDGFLVSFQE